MCGGEEVDTMNEQAGAGCRRGMGGKAVYMGLSIAASQMW